MTRAGPGPVSASPFADRRIVVTGGLGFIGSGVVLALCRAGARVWNIDVGTYAANPDNLAELPPGARVETLRVDVADAEGVRAAWRAAEPEIVFHLAAESHVDRSIQDAGPFLRTNVEGSRVLLDQVRAGRTVERYVHVGTDEVYGDIPPDAPPADEDAPLRPSSPYSASKAAGDLLASSYARTYGLPVAITRGSNTYGPRQFPEKLLPHMLMRAFGGEPLPIYGDGQQTRDWLYVDDHVAAILAAASGRGIYNLSTGVETSNLDVVARLLSVLGPRLPGRLGDDDGRIVHVPDRPGHDRRYAVDAGRARRALGWAPAVSLDQGLGLMAEWYTAHPQWLERIRTQEHAAYLERVYGTLPKVAPGPGAGPGSRGGF